MVGILASRLGRTDYLILPGRKRIRSEPSALNEVNNEHNDSNHKQKMDQTAANVADKAQKPEHDQYYNYCPEHRCFFRVRLNFRRPNLSSVLFTCQDFSARLSVSKIAREILAMVQAQFGVNPVWDPIHKDPRFEEIVASACGRRQIKAKTR